ncbi:MAG: M15 family metallopeptidase [Pseudomonadota bacterium]
MFYLFLTGMAVLVLVVVYCWFFCQFWTHVDTREFRYLTEFRSRSVTGHRGRQILVHREFVPFLKALEERAWTSGLDIVVTGSYRKPEARLSDTVVAPATRSNHLAGHAIDLNVRHAGHLYESRDLGKGSWDSLPFEVRTFFDEVRKIPPFRWGGDFTQEDPVHVDSGLNQSNPGAWEQSVHDCFTDIREAPMKWQTWLKSLVHGTSVRKIGEKP